MTVVARRLGTGPVENLECQIWSVILIMLVLMSCNFSLELSVLERL